MLVSLFCHPKASTLGYNESAWSGVLYWSERLIWSDLNADQQKAASLLGMVMNTLEHFVSRSCVESILRLNLRPDTSIGKQSHTLFSTDNSSIRLNSSAGMFVISLLI